MYVVDGIAYPCRVEVRSRDTSQHIDLQDTNKNDDKNQSKYVSSLRCTVERNGALSRIDHFDNESQRLLKQHVSKVALPLRDESVSGTSENTSDFALTEGVSIVVPTRNRIDSLRRCLNSVLVDESTTQREMIVVFNQAPDSETTAFQDEFPDVHFIFESRRGSSSARNTGIRAANKQLVVMIDDDTLVPRLWLDNLAKAFSDPNLSAATGNVLPWELKNKAQYQFEIFGGLGRGLSPFQLDLTDYRYSSLPQLWSLGSTTYFAIRKDRLMEKSIRFDERLGAGVPTKGGEDMLMFYHIVAAGLTIRYLPNCFVWHCHRSNMKELCRQLFAYGMGSSMFVRVLESTTNDRRFLRLRRLCYTGTIRKIGARILRRRSISLRMSVSFLAGLVWGDLTSRHKLRNNKA